MCVVVEVVDEVVCDCCIVVFLEIGECLYCVGDFEVGMYFCV